MTHGIYKLRAIVPVTAVDRQRSASDVLSGNILLWFNNRSHDSSFLWHGIQYKGDEILNRICKSCLVGHHLCQLKKTYLRFLEGICSFYQVQFCSTVTLQINCKKVCRGAKRCIQSKNATPSVGYLPWFNLLFDCIGLPAINHRRCLADYRMTRNNPVVRKV